MSDNSDVSFRTMTPDDMEFVMSLVPRLSEFGPPEWRDADQMNATDVQVIGEKFSNPAGAAFFIAEDADGIPVGFLHLQQGVDYYNKEEHGHIAEVIVAPNGEGRGVGSALMKKAEDWARERGYRWLTLSVFAQNVRARELYERKGYGPDMMKYVKELD